MDKIDLTQQFALRLKKAMLAQNLSSPRSTSGVCIHKLAEITEYSTQICRRYLRGEALPEPSKLVEIATKLKVSPGWLLFGDQPAAKEDLTQQVVINKDLLHYILTQAAHLYNENQNRNYVSDFLLNLIVDVSQINAPEEQTRKMIDLSLSFLNHFKTP